MLNLTVSFGPLSSSKRKSEILISIPSPFYLTDFFGHSSKLTILLIYYENYVQLSLLLFMQNLYDNQICQCLYSSTLAIHCLNCRLNPKKTSGFSIDLVYFSIIYSSLFLFVQLLTIAQFIINLPACKLLRFSLTIRDLSLEIQNRIDWNRYLMRSFEFSDLTILVFILL